MHVLRSVCSINTPIYLSLEPNPLPAGTHFPIDIALLPWNFCCCGVVLLEATGRKFIDVEVEHVSLRSGNESRALELKTGNRGDSGDGHCIGHSCL